MSTSFSSFDQYLFHEGTDYEVYRKMGAHPAEQDGTAGTRFTLWAPSALSVSVICARNGWDPKASPMNRTENGVWELFLPEVGEWDSYRYVVTGADHIVRYKSDPYAFFSELRPSNASVVWNTERPFDWKDADFLAARDPEKMYDRPMAIYEVHLGSWKKDYRKNESGFLNYRELADQLAEYVVYMGYTHVELIGICEHPLDASWGYQVTGYYSPTSRYGTPDDFKYFVSRMHQSGIGVILDWVPAHFPKDTFGLERFDGTPLYEPADTLKAEYPEWGTLAFDHAKPEVRSFLIGNAFYWIREFHIDALRVDAVAAMLYLSFGRRQWCLNREGGLENLESIDFLRQLNSAVRNNTDGYLIAEDSSIMEGITKPVEEGGIGFAYKWNMGWMNDTLRYIEKDPLYRGWHHNLLTHSPEYAFLEHFMLVLSHDEVVHLKHSMLEKFPGPMPDKIGGLKTLYTYMFTHPGKKLLFMGQDFAEDQEWSEQREINWSLASNPWRRDVMDCVRNLLALYRKLPSLYTDASNPTTFQWINNGDGMRSTISYIRRNPWNYNGAVVVVLNFSPIGYSGYTTGVPLPGRYACRFSTYDSLPGNRKSMETLDAEPGKCDGYPYLLRFELRPYESVIFTVPDEKTQG